MSRRLFKQGIQKGLTDSPTLALAKRPNQPSISNTRRDAGCQDLMIERLKHSALRNRSDGIWRYDELFGLAVVQKRLFLLLLATLMLYLLAQLSSGTLSHSNHYRRWFPRTGRSANAEGSLASMIVAVEQFIAKHPDHAGSNRFPYHVRWRRSLSSTVRYVLLKHWWLVAENICYNMTTGRTIKYWYVGDVVKNGRQWFLSLIRSNS